MYIVDSSWTVMKRGGGDNGRDCGGGALQKKKKTPESESEQFRTLVTSNKQTPHTAHRLYSVSCSGPQSL